MNHNIPQNPKEHWEKYRDKEIAHIVPTLNDMGVTLDETQVHVSGERYLQSDKKLVLMGEKKGSGRIIVKTSTSPKGKAEIGRERRCREILNSINFAYQDFFLPQELFFKEKNGCLLTITSYIEQDQHFIDRPLEDQFFLSLRALETQESVHATAYSHTKIVQDVFGIKNSKEYIREFTTFKEQAVANDPGNEKLRETFEKCYVFLKKGENTIARYSGFLTHSDFVPHNIRIKEQDIYLLDHTSIYFGNKYESWARFINFMVHHNPDLEKILSEYVRANRGEEEYLSLRLMRVYKLGFLVQYYSNTLKKTIGDMHKLMRVRLTFWTKVMNAVLNDTQIDKDTLAQFLRDQNMLRSDEERARRKEIISARE